MTSSKPSLPLTLLLLTILAPVRFAAADNPDWMRWLADSTSLAALSIPGTHDTMANQADSASGVELPWGLTQTLELRPQLDSGIRALDICARHIGDRFTIHHGAYYLQANFDDVLSTTVQFLRDHPRETILMRVKQEHTEEFCTRSFIDTFRWYRDQPAYSPFIWRGTTIPTLGEVRGKIVILDDFSGGAHGINWWMATVSALGSSWQTSRSNGWLTPSFPSTRRAVFLPCGVETASTKGARRWNMASTARGRTTWGSRCRSHGPSCAAAPASPMHPGVRPSPMSRPASSASRPCAT